MKLLNWLKWCLRTKSILPKSAGLVSHKELSEEAKQFPKNNLPKIELLVDSSTMEWIWFCPSCNQRVHYDQSHFPPIVSCSKCYNVF
jgi:hypothetical protein